MQLLTIISQDKKLNKTAYDGWWRGRHDAA